MDREDVNRFWSFCASGGVTSKPLALVPRPQPSCSTATSSSSAPVLPFPSPIALISTERIRHGAPLISVPYTMVWNAQNLRGGLVPSGIPPIRVVRRCFFPRKGGGAVDAVTVQSLWLAGCVAGYRKGLHAWRNETGRPDADGRETKEPFHAARRRTCSCPWRHLAPLLSPTLHFPLHSPFDPSNAVHYPLLAHLLPADLEQWQRHTLRCASAFHQLCVRWCMALSHSRTRPHRRQEHPPLRQLIPEVPELLDAYYMVLHRSLLLPLHGEPSAPGDLSELLEAAPELPLLPSLVPLVELIRSVPATQGTNSAGCGRPSESGASSAPSPPHSTTTPTPSNAHTLEPNCTLYTCQQSEFVSPRSRQRVMAAPTSSILSDRRVVVCAARDIAPGEELMMGF